jgi:cysteinyl-tRNA synthetase
MFFRKVDQVLAVIEDEEEILPKEVEILIHERNEARKNKNFKRADEIRMQLAAKGIELEDTKDGTLWKKAL